MSVKFFIGPFDPKLWEDENNPPDPKPESSLRIDPTAYKKALLQRWPTARGGASKHFAGMWTLDEYNLHGVEVHLNNDLQYVSLSSNSVNFIEFILWHRAYVPAEHELFLFNDSGWDSLVLTPATTKEDIVEFTGFRDHGLKIDSPLNGSWDGSVVSSYTDDKTDYRCTIHLFDHEDELRGHVLLGKHQGGSGSIYVMLRGTCTEQRDQLELRRKKTIDVIREGLGSKLVTFQDLKLQFEDGDPPTLHGMCGDDGQTLARLCTFKLHNIASQ